MGFCLSKVYYTASNVVSTVCACFLCLYASAAWNYFYYRQETMKHVSDLLSPCRPVALSRRVTVFLTLGQNC
jgi:hypothetical protein